ncbi:MAG: hypothetical protein KDM81_10605, partial [Verrucomicrobiae bacterium]|nr:hypothetical protein [Verrucomicrobiae bacterium]
MLPAGFARTDCPACGALLRPSAQSARSARAALGRIADWTLETEISRSPRAVVFRARHATTGQPVAVKVLSPPAQADSDWTEAALERLERATRLRSEHTVRVRACGVHDGSPYAVLDWTDEGSLAGDLPLPPTLAARLVAQVAEAVHEAHAAGLVHGGISLGHLFVDERGNARLVGFAAAPRAT